MADDAIQDDHPELPPRSELKPEREPVVIEGEATDLTPRDAESSIVELPGEPVAEDLYRVEPEAEASSEVAPEPVAEATETPAAFEPEVRLEPWGSAAEPETSEAAPAPEVAQKPPEPEATAEPPAPPIAPPRSGFASALTFVGYAFALVVIVVVALFVGAYIHNPFSDAMTASEQRVDALEVALKSETAARMALEGRVAATEANSGSSPSSPKLDALDARIAKLEAAPRAAPAPTSAAAPTVQPPVDGALADRVSKLEAALAAPKPANPEVAALASGQSALDDRIAKLEMALAAQKSEARAAPIALAKGLDPVAQAVAAISLAERLSAGEPYAAEYAALAKSGADAGALAALKLWADSGAPTPAKLADDFNKLGPSLSTSVKPEASGKVVDKMMDQLRGLVKVRVVGEIEGDDPAALASQISRELRRGDIAAALATEAKLPESARAIAAGWAKDAEGLESATAAARSLAETALRRFADAKN